ncbi:hypothetical protein [Sphingobacterium sp. 2149]|uniref:hypothetical protein n=1 Tax=Sphingobacterium sp. 2149 TaxID=2817763 RepID=UPI0028622232|nr:hypothetical protein [Sphingobacterium sp. 2149]MDR6734917.1 hypothetical protein [Sphingobacterium sp. 2149]
MIYIKLPFSLLIVFFTINIVKGQHIDSISARAEYGSKIEDVRMLMDIDDIDYYKVSFLPKKLKKNSYLLINSKEYWKGVVLKNDTLLQKELAKEYFNFENVDSTTILSLLTKPKGDSVAFHYKLLGADFKVNYKRIPRGDYSLRDGLVTNEKFKNIPINKTLPLFIYSLPYEDPKRPGYLFYCELTAYGIPPEKWWEKYKIEHFIVVEMKIASD